MGLEIGVEVEDLAKLERDRTWPMAGRPALGEGQPATAENLCHMTLAVAMRLRNLIEKKKHRWNQWRQCGPRCGQKERGNSEVLRYGIQLGGWVRIDPPKPCLTSRCCLSDS